MSIESKNSAKSSKIEPFLKLNEQMAKVAAFNMTIKDKNTKPKEFDGSKCIFWSDLSPNIGFDAIGDFQIDETNKNMLIKTFATNSINDLSAGDHKTRENINEPPKAVSFYLNESKNKDLEIKGILIFNNEDKILDAREVIL